MHLEGLTIKSNIRDYKVFFEKNNDFLKGLSELQNTVFVIDENVWKMHKDGVLKCLPADKIIVQPISEDIKNIDTVCAIYEKIMSFAPRKNITLVSIGGGIIQDITGFVASSLYRGINWIFIPTTLLAQDDSCIGAKTSLNFKHFKNLIGTFYPPSKIYIHTDFLKTLTKQDYYSGVGEMAKLHLMNGEKDTKDFINSLDLIDKLDEIGLLERIQNCLKIKKSYIESDEFDTGKRNMLNFGHCFGHAIESSTNFAIPHGQAVVIGMLLANKMAVKKNILSKEQETYIREKVLLPVLKVNIPKVNIEETIKAMRQDKKNTGEGLALVMINDDYQMIKITDLKENEVEDLLREIND